MKAKTTSKPAVKSQNKAAHSHKHLHTEGIQSRPHPLTQFFGCCLGDEPTPLSDKIQSIRSNLHPGTTLSEVTIEAGQDFLLTKDMIVGDILVNFPQTQPYFQELHPLGLLSPALNHISLEIFFSDLPVDLDQICQELTQLVNQKVANA